MEKVLKGLGQYLIGVDQIDRLLGAGRLMVLELRFIRRWRLI